MYGQLRNGMTDYDNTLVRNSENNEIHTILEVMVA